MSPNSILRSKRGLPAAPMPEKLRRVISIGENDSSDSCKRFSRAAPLRASLLSVQYLQASQEQRVRPMANANQPFEVGLSYACLQQQR
ncbi:hypothetical protein KCU65_g198, partial [Aureobasidium melanogenum]